MAVRVVAYFLGRPPAARPSRMVTGSDVIRTNRFLQEVAEVILVDKRRGWLMFHKEFLAVKSL